MWILLYCVSVSHKTAPAEIREKFNYSREEKIELLRQMRSIFSVKEALVLCTCNRTEFYFCGDKNSVLEMEKLVSRVSNVSLDDIKEFFRIYGDKKSIEHIFRVTCGIESMIIGEDEILGQVKNAYSLAHEAGTTGFILNSVFQKAIACSKKIKTDTPLSKTPVSTATLTARTVFYEDFSKTDKNVLLIGATGEMGKAILNNLLSKPNIYIICPLRKKLGFVPKDESRVKCVPYEERYQYMDWADAVVSATSSPHYTVMRREIEKRSIRDKKRLFIDIAVPRDIDENVAEMKNTRLVTIDDFEIIAEENNRLKLQAVDWAVEICEKYQDELNRDMIFHDEFGTGENIDREKTVSLAKLLFKAKKEMDSHGFSQLIKIMKELDEVNI